MKDNATIRCKIGELFSAVETLENHSFELDVEYLQKSKIQIQDENNNWCNVPALIKKESATRRLTFSDESFIECADKHLIRISGTTCEYAEDVLPGDEIQKTNGTFLICMSNELLTKNAVYDLQIDNETHLYQTANGMVHHNTLLAQTIARLLDVPFTIADATTITESGLSAVPLHRNMHRTISLIAGNSFGTISSQAYYH
jgi:hypothetical protein